MQDIEQKDLETTLYGSIWQSTGSRRVLEEISYRFGPRPAGSRGMHDALQYMATVFTGLGLQNIRLQPVSLTGWEEGGITRVYLQYTDKQSIYL